MPFARPRSFSVCLGCAMQAVLGFHQKGGIPGAQYSTWCLAASQQFLLAKGYFFHAQLLWGGLQGSDVGMGFSFQPFGIGHCCSRERVAVSDSCRDLSLPTELWWASDKLWGCGRWRQGLGPVCVRSLSVTILGTHTQRLSSRGPVQKSGGYLASPPPFRVCKL